MSDCVEVPLTELMRSIPEDYVTCEPTDWDIDGAEIGHANIPVGRMMHKAANEIDRLRADLRDIANSYYAAPEVLRMRAQEALDKKVETT